jgi:hypothetical protein
VVRPIPGDSWREFAGGYVVLGVGWYISIAAAPVWIAMILGFLFGAWLLPRKSGEPAAAAHYE